jgi:hypothetical protein
VSKGPVSGIFPLLVALGVLCACGDRQPAAPAATSPGDDFAIFSAMLAQACAHPVAAGLETAVLDVPKALMQDETTGWQWEPPAEVVAGLLRRQSSGIRWPASSPCAAQRVMDGDGVAALIASDHTDPPSYEPFRAAFPNVGAIVRISLPAYAPDGNHAMALRTYDHWGVGNAGEIVELQRSADGWQATAVHNAWVRAL